VCNASDCGIVVNPDGAANQAEGSIVDGIGVAMYGNMSFGEGIPDKDNLDSYELIRISDTPRKIDVHFVKNEIDPTGMGEPAFPPVMAALANALYRATGKRYYHQPFIHGA
jgi:CO/xanthine dehydrogenase Mo-binding subunit